MLEKTHCEHSIYFKEIIAHFETKLENFLKDVSEDNNIPLYQAIPYSILNGGKRLRSLLVYLIGDALNNSSENITENKLFKSLDAAAIAVELIHGYSLVHDDLPAMDNDDLRRGKPTCHKAFNEAIAILAGDALQSLAFQILSDPNLNPIAASQQSLMIHTLAKAIGPAGMVGGQALDMFYEGSTCENIQVLCDIHHKKTGALIEACVLLAAIAVNSKTHENSQLLEKLKNFGRTIGLLFQVQDDILDELSATQTLGKTAGKDKEKGKATFPALLGIDGAKAYANDLYTQALETMSFLEPKNDNLIKLVEMFFQRSF